MSPLISFVVAAYEKPERLDSCLYALRRQIFTDYEIIVSDDGSPTDANARVAQAYGARFLTHPRTIHPVSGLPTRSTPKVINQGVEAAAGLIVQTLQEDHILSPDFGCWIARTVAPGTAVWGLTDHSTRLFTHADIDAMLRTLFLPDDEERYEKNLRQGRALLHEVDDWRQGDGLDLAFHRNRFIALDTDMVGQDHSWMDMILRLRLAGVRLMISPMMRLYHQDEPPAGNAEQWQRELAESYAFMMKKWGDGVWTYELRSAPPVGSSRGLWAERAAELGVWP